jgi:flagellar basal-body rod protein FlgC
MDGIFSSLEISGSGMSVQRRRMNVVAENIANAETTKTKNGKPYVRKRLEVKAEDDKLPFKTLLRRSYSRLTRTNDKHLPGLGDALSNRESVARAEAKVVDQRKDVYRRVYDPSHPDADENGYVEMPNIEIINEMVDMMTAGRAYEANAMAISAAKEMTRHALDI